MARTIAFVCSLGDLTVGWDATNDADMIPIIQKMLDSKIRFHITRKRKKVEVEKLTQALDARKITLPDESLQRLKMAGLLMVGAFMMGESTGEIAETAEQVIENDTVATQPAGGG